MLTASHALTVSIPGSLRASCGDLREVALEAATVRGALIELVARFPALTGPLLDEQGVLRRSVNVFLNEEDIRFLGSSDPAVSPGDRLDIIQAISGG